MITLSLQDGKGKSAKVKSYLRCPLVVGCRVVERNFSSWFMMGRA